MKALYYLYLCSNMGIDWIVFSEKKCVAFFGSNLVLPI